MVDWLADHVIKKTFPNRTEETKCQGGTPQPKISGAQESEEGAGNNMNRPRMNFLFLNFLLMYLHCLYLYVFISNILLITDRQAQMRDDNMEATEYSECLKAWDNIEFCALLMLIKS